MSGSCLVNKLQYYLELTPAEQAALKTLEKSPKAYPAGTTVIEEGDDAETLYIVAEGWLISSNILLDGRRQILRLWYPGDVVGSSSIAFEHAAATVVVGEDAVLCRFPKAALGEIFNDHPRLAALFYSIGMLENVALSDRLKVLGVSSGKGKLAGLIIEMLSRLRMMKREALTGFELKLTQVDIGDAVGLTDIHVNRLFRALEFEDQAIMRKGQRIEIVDEDFLREISSFTDRYQRIDHSWFPPSRS